MTEMRSKGAAFCAAFVLSSCLTHADAPSALQCEAVSMSGIRVMWVDNSADETGFVLERTRDHVNWTTVTTTGVDVASFTDSGLEAGIVYMYRVKALTASGDSDYSNWHFAATMCPIAPPWTPYDVKASYTPAGHVVLTWSEHFGEETGFEIQRNVGLGHTNYATVGSNVTEFIDTNPPLGSNIYYMVRAINSTTNTQWAATPAGVQGGTTSGFYIRLARIDASMPAPSNVVAEVLGPQHVRITWDHVATNQGGYTVLCSWDNRHFRQVMSTYSNVMETMLARAIVPGHTYYIRVVANAGSQTYSVPSATAPFITIVDPELPAPSHIRAFKPADYHVELGWKDNSTNETGFAIIGQNSWITNVAANVTNVTLTGSPNGSYTAYTVRALNGTTGSVAAGMCWVSQSETPTFYGRYSSDETPAPRTNAVIASGTPTTSPVTVTTKSRPYFTELQISGTSGDDHILISQSNDTIIVTANGQAPINAVGPFGDIQVKGGDGNDTIIIDSSVSVRNRLYGEVGNDALNAFGSGKNILVTIGSGNDTCVGNGVDTSYWVDQSGVDTVHASHNEILAGRVHRVTSFYGGVTKSLYPGNLPDDSSYQYKPFSNGYSLWGECPTMFDVDQGHHQNCPMTGRQQMTAHQQMDRLQEMACDMGDNTYVVEYGDPSDRTYARVDSQFSTSIAQMPPSENVWWIIIEKVTYSLGLGLPAPKTYYQRWLNVWDTDDAVYEKFKAELEAGRVIGDFVGTPEPLGSDARIAGHYHGFAHVYRNAAGEPRFIIRNPYGQEFERNIPPFDPCQGLFDLSMDEMKAAFSQAVVTDYRVPPLADAGSDVTVTDVDSSGSETVTLSASNTVHWRPVTHVWSEDGIPVATGETAELDLPVGTHLINLTTTDDDGSVGSDAAVVTVLHGAMPGFVGEAGTVTTNQLDGDTWHSTVFSRPYTNPIVVMGPPSFAESDATTMRVRNVTPTGFEWQFDEWERVVLNMFWYIRVDGPHTNETVSWVVAEAGLHELEDGRHIAAAMTTCDYEWKAVVFGHTFPSPPVVLAQCMSQNDVATVTPRIRNVTTTGFEVRLQEEEDYDDDHGAELLGWIAVEQATGTTAGIDYEAHTTGNSVTHSPYPISFGRTYSNAPVFIARIQTYNGADPCDLRRTALSASGATVFVEEETSGDTELTHGTEVVGYLAMQSGTMDVAPDTDGDGVLNHLDTDDDNDGMSDADEAVAGTDSLSASSLLAIQSLLIDADGCSLQFNSVSGRYYTAECSTNLLGTNWMAMPACIDLFSTGGVMQVQDTNGWDQTFYRIRVHE